MDDGVELDPLRRRGSIRKELLELEIAQAQSKATTLDEWQRANGYDATTRTYSAG